MTGAIAYVHHPERLTELGHNLQRLCAERRLKGLALAEMAGIGHNTLCRMYYEDCASIANVRKVATALDVPLYELFTPPPRRPAISWAAE